MARTLASLSSYVATTDADGVQIHQYAEGRIRAELATGALILDVETEYPATGRIKLTVAEAHGTPVSISLRVPGWASGATLNAGEGMKPAAPGTVTVTQTFQPGEEIVLDLPMEPRLSWPDDRVDAVRGCAAVERGPEVFALESVDLPEGWKLDEARIDAAAIATQKDGAVTVTLVGMPRQAPARECPFVPGAQDDAAGTFREEVALVPYHSWAERGSSTMRIWIPTFTGRPHLLATPPV